MPTPSLLIVPARFKTGKLYSQIPVPVAPSTSSVGDFTVTRNTAATRVGPDGLIASVASGIPRLDYYTSGGVTGCPALLVEPAATNIVPSGTAFNSSTGVQYSGVTDSPAAAISGTLVTKNEASGTIRYGNQTFSATALASGTTYTVSRFFKYNGVEFTTSLQHNNTLQWGSVGWVQPIVLSAASGVTLGASTLCTGSIENFGNGWHRVNVRVTTGAVISGAVTVTVLSILPAALSTGQGFLTACPQLETGSVATSYIPTTTAAVTRNADVITVTGAVSGSIGQTEGTIYVEIVNTLVASYAEAYVYRVFADANNEIWARKEGGGNTYSFRWRANSQNTTFLNVAVPNGVSKIAFGYKSGDTALFLNGSQVATTITDVRAFSVNPTTIALGSTSSGQFFNDRIRALALYTTRLSNAELAALTTP